MNRGLKVIPSVFTAIIRNNEILLLRRQNTGWLDGYYDLPAGHLEDKETLKEGTARELKEEACLDVKLANLRLIHIYQNHNNPERPHYGFVFQASSWKGTPKIGEPDKCNDIGFFPLDNLPTIPPYVRAALSKLGSREVTFSYHKPGSITGKP